MDEKYIVRDIRAKEDFKKKSFSGYKKTEVISEYFKSCDNRQIENALHWITDIHCSGYLEDYFERVFNYISNNIHLNSFNLPSIVWNHCECYKNIRTDTKNLQKIRNAIYEITALIVTTDTHRKLIKKKVIKDNDFNMNKLSKMLISSTNHIPANIIKSTDPRVLTIVMNELAYCITKHDTMQGSIQDKKVKDKEFYMDKAVYWICWIHKWELIQKKNGGSPDCSFRKVSGVTKEDSCDIIWICWSIILAECKNRRIDPCILQIVSLYNMYKYNFTRSKKSSKMSIIIHVLALLILEQHNETKISDSKIIESVMKSNMMYSIIKKYEIKEKRVMPNMLEIQPAKKKAEKEKKDKRTDKEIESMNKIDMVFEIDMGRQNI